MAVALGALLGVGGVRDPAHLASAQELPLLPLRVVGPVSECSDQVLVEGQFSGATVSVFANDVQVGGGVALWSRELFAVTAQLSPGDLLHAVQLFGGVESPPPAAADRVQVQPQPVDVAEAYVHLNSVAYECGRCVQVSGAVPGSSVLVTVDGTLRGSSLAPTGTAGVDLNPASQRDDVLRTGQEACGATGPLLDTPVEADFPGRPDGRLRQPVFSDSLLACDEQIRVTGLAPGATVFVERSSGPTHFGCSPVGTWVTSNIAPLEEGETVTLRQAFEDCEIESDVNEMVVGATLPVPIPAVLGQVCTGTSTVRVTNLRPGATVRISIDGGEAGFAQASDTTQDLVLTQAPPDGATLTAAQSLCDNWSEESEPVTVEAVDDQVDAPGLPGPLHACATQVLVEDLVGGSVVTVRDGATGLPRSAARYVAHGGRAVLEVTPALIPGETIVVTARGCAGEATSDPATVEPVAEGLRLPRIKTPLLAADDVLEIENVVPGATVDVSVDGVWTYSVVSVRDEVPVSVPNLAVGMSFRCRQRLCFAVSEVSNRADVRPPAPTIETDDELPDAPVGASYSFQFEARGGVQPYEWSDYGLVPSGLSLSSTGLLSGVPEIAGHYGFDVTARDSGSPPLEDTKHVKMQTVGGGTQTTGVSSVDIWNCETNGHTVHVWSTDLTAATGWEAAEDGALSHQGGAGGCPGGAAAFKLELEDGHEYLVAVVDPDNDQCPGHQNDPTLVNCIQVEPFRVVVDADSDPLGLAVM